MKKSPRWLDEPFVLAIHERLLAEHGGAAGVRDSGLLASGIARPRQLHRYEKPDLFELAAAYADGIANNHPFLDGNKCTAFLSAYVFLADNGQYLVAAEEQAVLMTRGLADGSISQKEYAAWLRRSCEARK